MVLTNEQLLDKRLKMDPVADRVIAAIMERGDTVLIAELFNTLTANVDIPDELLPQEAIDYFKNTKALPAFYDKKLIDKAQHVFGVYGPEISMILLCKSLPQCYACAHGAKVLYHTGRFVEHNDNFDLLTKRLMETAQFVIDVLSPGSFEKDGNAIITTQKVRLIHAAIRFFIIKSGRWDSSLYGEPINQEDLAGTLMSFSALVIEGLGQLGIELSEEETDAYFHVWRVIGHVIGLDEDLIPENAAEGLKLGYAIFNQQLASSKEGIALTASAIGFMEHVTPGTMFDSIPAALVYHFLGEKIAPVVGIQAPSGFIAEVVPRLMIKLFGEYDDLEDSSVVLQKITQKFNRTLLKGLLLYFNKGKNVTFDIPKSLQQDWQLQEHWDNTWTSPSLFGTRIAIQKSNLK